jgi:hypothetical protein
MLYYT